MFGVCSHAARRYPPSAHRAPSVKGRTRTLRLLEPSIVDARVRHRGRRGPRRAGAVRAHRDARPDLVLLDLGLPGLDGLEVLQRVRAERDTPVIVLTARDEPHEPVEGC
jgi:DNA-binding response OmpR family regulator